MQYKMHGFFTFVKLFKSLKYGEVSHLGENNLNDIIYICIKLLNG